MSKRGFISRYLLIIKKLKAKPYSTLEELRRYMENQLEYLSDKDDTVEIGFSKRTLQRDIKEIRNLFGIDIEYSRKQNGYFINQTEAENMNFNRMMEVFDVFNSLNLARDSTPYIHLEKRQPQGTENLHGLLHAIKNRFTIKFAYQKFWDEKGTVRFVNPYALKEFKNRWYLLAKDNKDGNIKSFGLDRLSQLDITNQKFEYPQNYNPEESYRYYFGIINPDDLEPREIVLSFNSFQGKYIKTLPLHHSQQVLIDNENELRIKLKLCITYDFVMELLSFGAEMQVLQPASLADEIKSTHQKASMLYAN